MISLYKVELDDDQLNSNFLRGKELKLFVKDVCELLMAEDQNGIFPYWILLNEVGMIRLERAFNFTNI